MDGIDVLVRIDERQILLDRTRVFCGGTISATGTLPMQGFDFGTASATIVARDVNLAVVDGVKTTIDADLTSSWDAHLGRDARGIPRVVGDVRLMSVEYTRPITMEADICSIVNDHRKARETGCLRVNTTKLDVIHAFAVAGGLWLPESLCVEI